MYRNINCIKSFKAFTVVQYPGIACPPSPMLKGKIGTKILSSKQKVNRIWKYDKIISSTLFNIQLASLINPSALRQAKIAYNFGLSECNRVIIPKPTLQCWLIHLPLLLKSIFIIKLISGCYIQSRKTFSKPKAYVNTGNMFYNFSGD